MDRFLVDPRQIRIGGKPLSEITPPEVVDREAFLETGLDTPSQRRDKKRRRQVARRKMVELGRWPPSVLDQTW